MASQSTNLIQTEAFGPVERLQTSTSIDSLPVELLSQILQLAATEPDDEMLWERKKTLCTLQLVSKLFNEVATRLLWEQVHLLDDAQALRMLESGGFERHQVHSLLWESREGGSSLQPLLEVVTGLLHLTIFTFDNLDFGILCLPSLSNLLSLQLMFTSIHTAPTDPSPTSVLFPSLQLLNVVGSTINSPTPYSSFLTPSLTHLNINPTSASMITEAVKEDCRLCMDRVGSHLLTLTIRFMPPFPALFRSFTALKSFDIDCRAAELVEAVRAFPRGLPLTTLRIAEQEGSLMHDYDLVPALAEVVLLPGFEKVEVLKLGWWSRDQILRVDGGPALLSELERREITVIFGYLGLEGESNPDWVE